MAIARRTYAQATVTVNPEHSWVREIQQCNLEHNVQYCREQNKLEVTENIVPMEFYGYILFYCVHNFRDRDHMLAYVNWRKVRIHDGLVEDLGEHVYGFQDIIAIDHLCAKVHGANGKIYFVDDPELVEERLRESLL